MVGPFGASCACQQGFFLLNSRPRASFLPIGRPKGLLSSGGACGRLFLINVVPAGGKDDRYLVATAGAGSQITANTWAVLPYLAGNYRR